MRLRRKAPPICDDSRRIAVDLERFRRTLSSVKGFPNSDVLGQVQADRANLFQ